MFGGIIGDVVGSAYEGAGIKGSTLPLTPKKATITDDTILMAAVADALLSRRPFDERLRAWGQAHPDMGYGPGFESWLRDPGAGPYGSAGNGAAVRAIPIGWLAGSEEEVRELVFQATDCTHDHEASYRGAEAIAMAIFRLRRGQDSEEVFREISLAYDYLYEFSIDLEALHAEHGFDAHCDVTVPIAFGIAGQARTFRHAMSLGLYVGGDTDTILAMAGALREAMEPSDLPRSLVGFAFERVQRRAPELLPILAQVTPSLGEMK